MRLSRFQPEISFWNDLEQIVDVMTSVASGISGGDCSRRTVEGESEILVHLIIVGGIAIFIENVVV